MGKPRISPFIRIGPLSNSDNFFDEDAKRGTTSAIQFKPEASSSTKKLSAPRSTSSRYLADFNEKRARERRDAVSQYYRDHDITMASKKDSVRLSAAALLYTGKMHVDETDFLRTSQFLQTELPVRVAHRIKGFRKLPFIVVTNPNILKVMELYIRSFKIITQFNDGKQLKNLDEAEEFSKMLEDLLNVHGTVIDALSIGFRESHHHIVDYCGGDEEAANDLVKKFLDRSLTSRLGIRLLVTHHLLLRQQIRTDKGVTPYHHMKRTKTEQIGMIQTRWCPADSINSISRIVQQEFFTESLNPPRVKLNGHTEAMFPYFPSPGFEDILVELFRNAFRAVIDSHLNSAREMPAIDVTIAVNRDDFTIRIADRGRGISPGQLEKIWRYHYTKKDGQKGIGLPIAKAYAEYLGGSLEIKSLNGIGSDTYLKLQHVDPRNGKPFRI